MRTSNLLATATLGLGILFASCQTEGDANRQQLYNNFTKVDSEGFEFLKQVHEKASYEVAYAQYVATTSGFADAKALADSITYLYSEIIPQLEELAAEAHVILPDPGGLEFSAAGLYTDTANVFSSQDYFERFVHEQEVILDQFERASRNTYVPLRSYANEKLPQIKNLYAQAGGKEEEGAHH